MQDEEEPTLGAYGRARVAEVAADPATEGHAIFTPEAEELAGTGLWPDTVPVAANLVDIADRLGIDLGETEGCRMLILDGPERAVDIEPLGAVWLAALRRKAGPGRPRNDD